MALKAYIQGVEYAAVDDYTIKQQGGAVSQTTITVYLGTGSAPEPLQSVSLSLDSVVIFGGIVKSSTTPEWSTTYESYVFVLECLSWEAVFNFRTIKQTWFNKKYSEIVQDIFDTYLTEENLTAGTITATTDVIKKYEVQDKKIFDVLSDIAKKVGGATFYITPLKVFNFIVQSDFASISAPTHISKLKLSNDFSDIRTVQTVRGSTSRVTGESTNAALVSSIATKSGLSGKIESVITDSTIRNTTAAATEAANQLAVYGETEKILTCHTLDLASSQLFTMWYVNQPALGIVGYFVITDRTITHLSGNDVNINLTLRNRNFFTRYGYSLKAAANEAETVSRIVSDYAADNRLSPNDKIQTKIDWTTISGEVAQYNALADSYGVVTEKTAYNAAFQALADTLNNGVTWTTGLPEWLTEDNMSVTESIDFDSFRALWADYFAAREALVTACTNVVNQAAEDAQTAAENAQTAADAAAKIWIQTTAPTIGSRPNAINGDTWIDSDNGNVFYSAISGSWVLQTTSLPLDPTMYYSFDEIPEIPDNTAGITYLIGSNHADIWTGWTTGGTGAPTVTYSNGEAILTFAGAATNVSFVAPTTIGINGKNLIYSINADPAFIISSYIQILSTPFTVQDVIKPNLIKDTYIIRNVIVSDATGVNRLYFRFDVNAACIVKIKFFYLGTGATLSKCIDNSKNGKNGTLNAVTPKDGISGKAAWFNKTNSSIAIENNNTGKQFFSCWVEGKTRDAGVLYIVDSKYSFSFAYYFAISSISLSLVISGDGSTTKVVSYPTTFTEDCHIAWSFKPSVGIYIYKNGVKVAELTTGIPSEIFASSAQAYLGRRDISSTPLWFDGWIDEVVRFDYIPTDAEILGLYKAKALPKAYTFAQYQNEQAATDGVIMPQEKKAVYTNWFAINGNGSTTGSYWTARAKAVSLSVSVTSIDTARNALFSYLYTTPGVLITAYWLSPITISTATYNALWSDYYSAEAALLNAISNAEAIISPATYSPKYRGIGRLSSTSTALFAGYSVSSAGGIVSTGNVTPNTGDFMVNYFNAGVSTLAVFLWNGSAWTQTGVTAEHRAAAIEDIFRLNIAGIVIDEGTVYIESVIYKLFAKYIKILTGGSFRSGDRYDELGAIIDDFAKGAFIGSDGTVKLAQIEFSGDMDADNSVIRGVPTYDYRDYVKVPIPPTFSWSLPFGIYTDGKGNYSTDFDIDDYLPVIAGTTYYISTTGSDSNTGLSSTDPLLTIAAALNKGDAAKLILDGGVYHYGVLGTYSSSGISQSLIMESPRANPAIISTHKLYTWTKTGGYTNVYQATEAATVSDWCFDSYTDDGEGNYNKLTKVASIALVDSTAGSFYQTGGVIYVHTPDSRAPSGDELRMYLNVQNVKMLGNVDLFMKNIQFEGGNQGCVWLQDTAGGSPNIYASRCTFNYSSAGHGGFHSEGAGNTFFVRCRAVYNNQDGFNYHEGDFTSVTKSLEIDCVGMLNGDDTADNDQGSTTHDGLVAVRVNGIYIKNKAQGIGDITAGSQSLCVGTVAGDSKAVIDEDYSVSFCAFEGAEMWLFGCTSYGSKFDVRADVDATIYIANCKFDRAGYKGAGDYFRYDYRDSVGTMSQGAVENYQASGVVYAQKGRLVAGYIAEASAAAGVVYNALDAAIPASFSQYVAAHGTYNNGTQHIIYMVRRADATTIRVYYEGGYVAVTAASSGGAWYFSW